MNKLNKEVLDKTGLNKTRPEELSVVILKKK